MSVGTQREAAARYDAPVTSSAARARQIVTIGVVAVGSGNLLGACASTDDSTADVLAASSFTDVAEPLEALLEDELGLDVRFSFGSSGSFVEQIDQGAPADVVITADTATMMRLEDADLVAPAVSLVRNELIIVTADTAAGRSIGTLADLDANVDGDGDGDGAAIVVVCTSSAPCGAATDELLDITGVVLSPASREPNVRATLTKVLLGEADAAIVYRSDAFTHPELRAVEIDGGNVSVTGRVAVVLDNDGQADDAQEPDEQSTGDRIVDVLTGERAAALLAEAGFSAP